MAEAKETFGQANGAIQGGDFDGAKTCCEAALATLGWLQTNAALRAEAREKRVLASEIRRQAAEHDGPHLGLTGWRQGEAQRETAMAAYERGEFAVSGAAWDAAATAYRRSDSAARAALAEQALEVAKGARRRGAWEEVKTAAERVLELDKGNEEALWLVDEAQVWLVPKRMAVGRGVQVPPPHPNAREEEPPPYPNAGAEDGRHIANRDSPGESRTVPLIPMGENDRRR